MLHNHIADFTYTNTCINVCSNKCMQQKMVLKSYYINKLKSYSTHKKLHVCYTNTSYSCGTHSIVKQIVDVCYKINGMSPALQNNSRQWWTSIKNEWYS